MPATDLRNVLRYVPRFRGRTFVIAADGVVVADDNFANVLSDVAVLRSLGIRLVLAHGIGHQVAEWAKTLGWSITSADGRGVTDETTLTVAKLAATRAGHRILEGLFATSELRGAVPNAIKAKPAGVIKGVDQQFTGRVDQVEAGFLRSLLDADVIPVLPPLGIDSVGQTYRLGSDEVALAAATALSAEKLLYLAPHPGVVLDGRRLEQVPAGTMAELLRERRGEFPADLVSKIACCVEACNRGVPRAHILNGFEDGCLVNEIFSAAGTGTLIHINPYQSIRPAKPADVGAIWGLVRSDMQKEELAPRTRAEIARRIGEFYVFETDGAVLGCVALHVESSMGDQTAAASGPQSAGGPPPQPSPTSGEEDSRRASPTRGEGAIGELACLTVNDMMLHQGIGRRLAEYVENEARRRGLSGLYCLSTQAYTYFQQKLGYREASADILPPERRAKYEKQGRRSRVLFKALGEVETQDEGGSAAATAETASKP